MKKNDSKQYNQLLRRPGVTDWEKLYLEGEVETMPWFHPVLDSDLDRALEDYKIFTGATVLDLGTGPGTQAIALAELGFNVTATDISEAAIKKADQRIGERRRLEGRLDVEFIRDDILDTRLDKRFDVVIDRGCFHVLPPEKWRDYVRNVEHLLNPLGYLFLKCFSHLEPMEGGPYRFTPEEIKGVFGPVFKVLDIKETLFYGTLQEKPRALFCVMRKPEK